MRPPENLYHQNIAEDQSRSSCSLNRCNLSPWIIGSEEFQANPLPIEIDGARTTDAALFRRLEGIADAEERSRLFHDYVSVKFGLHEKIERRGKPKSVYSYVHLLRAWGADSNQQAGAVLKAWVESRFGILATYHNGRLADDPAAREAFLMDRMRGAAKSIGVLMQLDLLYTFCQDELRRRFPGERWKTLYRGTHDPEEYTIHHQNSGDGRPCPAHRAGATQQPEFVHFRPGGGLGIWLQRLGSGSAAGENRLLQRTAAQVTPFWRIRISRPRWILQRAHIALLTAPRPPRTQGHIHVASRRVPTQM